MSWNCFCRASALSMLVVLCYATSALAQEWSLTTADFQTKPVLLRGLSSDGLHVAWVDTKVESVVPLDQFVSVQPADR